MKHNRFIQILGTVAMLLGATGFISEQAFAMGLFSPPADNVSPAGEGTGGASRSSFFSPAPDNASPAGESTGGASRSSFFSPAPDNASPRGESMGGASRGSFFSPAPDNVSPAGEISSGAARGSFFEPTPGNASPSAQGTAGGASRANTYGAINSITVASMLAVMPENFYGTTLEARPTFLVYVPASDANEAVFSLKSETRELVYQMTVAVPQQGGVVALSLPADAPELALDQNYQWYLAMMLDGNLSPASPFVDGWVKRVSPDMELASTLESGEGLANVAALGANGIWYDTVAQLAMLNEAQPTDELAGHWYELLESVGLSEIAMAPVIL